MKMVIITGILIKREGYLGHSRVYLKKGDGVLVELADLAGSDTTSLSDLADELGVDYLGESDEPIDYR